MTMLTKVKLALRVVTQAFDAEIEALIDDCISELTMLGIYDAALADDPQIQSAVIFYCKAKFGAAEDAERWERIYKDKLEKLKIAADYGARM